MSPSRAFSLRFSALFACWRQFSQSRDDPGFRQIFQPVSLTQTEQVGGGFLERHGEPAGQLRREQLDGTVIAAPGQPQQSLVTGILMRIGEPGQEGFADARAVLLAQRGKAEGGPVADMWSESVIRVIRAAITAGCLLAKWPSAMATARRNAACG